MASFATLLCVLVGMVAAAQSHRSSQLTVQMSRSRCPGGRMFPGLGCFNGRAPFNNSNWLPQPPAVVGTTFQLYTRQHRQHAQLLDVRNRTSLTSSAFDPSLPTVMLIHGFLQNAGVPYLNHTTSALLQTGPMNVVVVGWGSGASLPYSQAVANTRVVGAEIARLLMTMRRRSNLDLSSVHLVGHSLGAHVAGYAGARLRGAGGVGRITGLDPADPNFTGYPLAVRLDKTDASFVDVIHTDGDPFSTYSGYGMMEAVGHVDFYPNGGHRQTGCARDSSVFDFVSDAFSQGLTRAEYDLSCSHERSTELFTASLLLHDTPCAFMAFPCSSEADFLLGHCQDCRNRPCPEMGLHANAAHGARGSFYLNTTGAWPYCGYHHFVRVYLPPSEDPQDGALMVRLHGQTSHSDWTQLRRDPESRYNLLVTLVLTPDDLGEITSVEVNFRSGANYFRRLVSGSDVTLDQVEVTCPMRRPTKYFCQPSMSVEHEEPITLSTGSITPGSCSVQEMPRSEQQ